MSHTLVIRRVADKSSGTRVERVNAITGKRELINPETGNPEPWPVAGIQIGHLPVGEGLNGQPVWEAPEVTGTSQREIKKGLAEGYITLTNPRAITCPSGPLKDPWGGQAPNHEFIQADLVTFRTIDGDITYRVTRNPGKYYESDMVLVNNDMSRYADPKDTFTTLHDFRLELVK